MIITEVKRISGNMENDQRLNEEYAEMSGLKFSHYDYLTGLPNLNGFLELADTAKNAIYEKDGSPVLLYIDLSSMRFFNHKYGFTEGNKLLQAFSKILVQYFSKENTSRLGQDHFAVMTEEKGIEEKLEALFVDSKKINGGRNLPVRVGIYPYRMEDLKIDTACDRAKFACDTLRNTYASCFCYFDAKLGNESERHQYVLENLDRALEEKWIKVYYQPIVRATNGKVCEEEALARWDDPEQGFLTPVDFVPALEEAGLIYKLDLYMVEQVLEKTKLLMGKGIPVVPQSINLSRSDFDSCDIVEEIRERVDASGLGRDSLIIELTESMIGRDFLFMKKQVERFRSLGFKVWMDDFGSGYSTLNLLQSIQVDLIKFDMRFMETFESGSAGKVILTELMKLAIGLNIDTVCEGVETEEEIRFLQEIGCEKLQGYYYNRPVPVERIIKRCESGLAIGVEDPEESDYYDAIGRINLYDLSLAASQTRRGANYYFDTAPMAIVEIKDDNFNFVRTNQSYRDFAINMVGRDVANEDSIFSASEKKSESTFLRLMMQCSREKGRSFISEKMPDNTIIKSVIRWIADNPHTGASAVAVMVLDVSEAGQDTTYENIARALAADYFRLYYVDLETNRFVEYSSDIGLEELAVERYGDDFFEMVRNNVPFYVYEEDAENFLFSFTKENMERALQEQGTYTLTYRRMIDGELTHVNMKAIRMQGDQKKVIIGINRIDDQARLEEGYERSVISSAVSGTEAAWLRSASLNTVSFAVKSCIRLMETGEFKDNVAGVLKDILKETQSEAVRILLVNAANKEVSVFSDAVEEGYSPENTGKIASLLYDIVASWERLIGEGNSILVKNEEDVRHIKEVAPEWAETLYRDDIRSVIIVPLRRADRTLGYMYAVNFNTNKVEKVKEMMELMSFFLSSEIESFLFRKELEILSNFDEMTGLKNRYSMLTWIRAFEADAAGHCCGVLTMDLNGLKRLNDTEGHFAGDRLIIDTTNMLLQEFGEEHLYRIGGDEFIALFPEIRKESFEERIARFRESLAKAGNISLAIGTWWSDECSNMEILFGHADENMYADKKAFYERHPELKDRK